jgi:CubicO group peptidase (beta-lactamase class C family)
MKRLIKNLLSLSLFFLLLVSSSWAQGLPTAEPEEVGLSADRLSRIEKVMKDYVSQKKIPGVVALVARKGKVAYLKSFGMMDIKVGKPMRNDTIFRIASMSKSITCTAAMILHEEGHFLLNDQLSRYIPEFKNPMVLASKLKDNPEQIETVPAKGPIRIKHLFTHTSGIGYAFNNSKLLPIYRNAGVPDGAVAIDSTIGEKMKILAGLPLAHHPGETVEYGLSIDVLGYLVEVVSGMTLDKFFKERIFKPLRMKDTCFFLPEEKSERLASLYEPTKDADLKKYPDGMVERGTFKFSPSFPYEGPKTYFSGGAGLCSTVSDYARYAQMFLNGGKLDGVRLLSRKSTEFMTINQVGDLSSPGFGIGYGLQVITDLANSGSIGSNGIYSHPGIFYTSFWVDPKEEMIGIMLAQIYPWGDLNLIGKFRVLANQAIID